MDEVHAWQQRPLGINMDGEKELLGLWMAQTEGAKFWLSVVTELKNRGVQDILIACVDGLKGFPEAIEAVYPKTPVQLCIIVHQVRHSLRYVSWKQRKVVAADLRLIYGAATLSDAEHALARFAAKWDDEHPSISRSWRANWERLCVFFDYPPQTRKVIYTTNAIESVNASLRKVTKTRSSFPTDKSVMKVLYLALHHIAKKWTMPIRDWKQAMSQFIILFGDCLSLHSDTPPFTRKNLQSCYAEYALLGFTSAAYFLFRDAHVRDDFAAKILAL